MCGNGVIPKIHTCAKGGEQTREHLLVCLLLEEPPNAKDIVVAYVWFWKTTYGCGGRSQNKEDLKMPKTLQVVFMEIWLYDNLQSFSFLQSNFQKDCWLATTWISSRTGETIHSEKCVQRILPLIPGYYFLMVDIVCVYHLTPFDKCSSQTNFILALFLWLECRGSSWLRNAFIKCVIGFTAEQGGYALLMQVCTQAKKEGNIFRLYPGQSQL